MLTILSEGEAILLKEQISQVLIGGDDIPRHTLKDHVLHLLNHNLSLSQCDMVNLDQRLLQQRLHDDIILRLAQFVSTTILIASFLGHCYAHLLSYIVFVKVCHMSIDYRLSIVTFQ